MRRTTLTVACLALLLAVWGCAPKAEQEAARPELSDIPITTASPEALANFERGQRALDVGRPQEAKELFRSAVQEDPGFAYAYLNIANSAASTQEFKANLDLAMEHLEGKSEGERLLVEINRTFLDNDAERRLELAQKAVELYPNSPRAWLTLGAMQGTVNENEAARQSMAKALELDPDFLAAHLTLGNSYLFAEPKSFDLAKQQMEKCVDLDPNEAKAYEALGDVYRAMQDLDQASEAYGLAIETDPTLSVASLKKGHVNSFLGNFEEARAAYDLGVEGAKEANRAFYANYRAFTHLHAGDPQAAIDELEEILASIPTWNIPEDQIAGAETFTLTNQATIALHTNRLDQAAKVLEKRAAVMRANADAVGDPDFTRQQEANILLFEGQLAARRGDYETARAKAEEHRQLIENDANPLRFQGYYGLLGLIDLLQENYGQAVESYKKANLNVMYVKYHLALAEEGAGNSEEAKRLFREVVEWNFNSVGFALVRKDAMGRLS